MNNFNFHYNDLLQRLLSPEAVEEFNMRTNTKIRVIPGGVSFKLDLSNDMLQIPHGRKFHIKTCAAEVAWFFMGTQNLDWFRKYSHIWNDFVEDDGFTVDSAYGYRWRSHFGRDQILNAIMALKANKSDRRIYISNWDPSKDGLGRSAKNVPCPLGFTLSIIQDRLHMSLTLRSSDVFVGLPYDVAGHTLIMKIIAETLKVKMGTLHVTLAHAHLYENHYGMAMETINNKFIPENEANLLNFNLLEVTNEPDRYVELVTLIMNEVDQTKYNPRPDIVV